MKNFCKVLFSVLLTLALLPVFTSCGDDNDDEGSISFNVTANYLVSLSPDLYNLVDVTVVYYDENGKEVTEAVADGYFSKQFTCSNADKLGYTMKMALKSNYNEILEGMDKETFTFTCNYTLKYLSSQGTQAQTGDILKATVEKDKAQSYIANHPTIVSIHYTWSEDSKSYVAGE